MQNLKLVLASTFCFCVLVFIKPLTFAQETATAVARVAPSELSVTRGTISELAIEIVDVNNLYAFDVTVNYDPQVVEIVDVDLAEEGVQLGLGTFLESDAVLANYADNERGVARVAMTQLNPSEAKTGTGVLAVLRIRGLQEKSDSPILLTSGGFAKRNGASIVTQLQSGLISVGSGALSGPTNTPIPLQIPGTPLPFVDATAVEPLPTQPIDEPTNTPTIPTATTVATAVESPTAATGDLVDGELDLTVTAAATAVDPSELTPTSLIEATDGLEVEQGVSVAAITPTLSNELVSQGALAEADEPTVTAVAFAPIGQSETSVSQTENKDQEKAGPEQASPFRTVPVTVLLFTIFILILTVLVGLWVWIRQKRT